MYERMMKVRPQTRGVLRFPAAPTSLSLNVTYAPKLSLQVALVPQLFLSLLQSSARTRATFLHTSRETRMKFS